MDNDDFSLNNLSNNPAYDFSSIITNSNTGSVNDIFNYDSDDSPYKNTHFSCEYVDVNQCIDQFKNNVSFSFLSLNIQSLHTKFNVLNDLINDM
jgi:hypothetical protein